MSRRPGDATRRRLLQSLAAGSLASVAGCVTVPGGSSEQPTPTQALLEPDSEYGYTHVQPTGNRVLVGASDLRRADPIEIQTSGRPEWLCALPGDSGSLWTVVTRGGSARTVRIVDGMVERVATYNPLPEQAVPLTRKSRTGVGLVRPPSGSAPATHPVVTDRGPLFIGEDGDLVFDTDEGDPQRFEIDGLPDGRIVRVDEDRWAVLGDATTRYDHGALGDRTEGGSLVVFDAAAGEVVTRASVGPPAVIEGLSPLVADLSDDDEPDIVVTLADSEDGARLADYRPDGTRRAVGPIFGPGWRHQLAVAPFASDGTVEVACVLKPHVNQQLEFYRLREGSLDVVATLDGYSTHTYGSVNTDGAIAADVDDDGQVELLLPTGNRDELHAVERTDTGARMDWEFETDGVVRSNVTGVTLADGRIAIGVGTDTGVRIWQG